MSEEIIKAYDIEADVPVPEGVPLDALHPGQSVAFPLSKRNSVQSRASKLHKTHGKKFTIKKIDAENARVWRVE